MKNLLSFTFFIVLSFQVFSIDQFLFDPIKKDSLFYSNDTKDIFIENLNTYNPITTTLFTLSNLNLEKKRQELIFPFLKNNWGNVKLEEKMIEKGAKHLKFLQDKNQLRLRGNQPIPKVLTKSIEVKPVSYFDSVLTFVQIVECELSNYRHEYKIVSYYYWDLKSGKLLEEAQLKEQLVKDELTKRLQKKWEYIRESLPTKNIKFDQYMGFRPLIDSTETDSFSLDVFAKVNAYLKNPNWEDASIYWTGNGILVKFKNVSSLTLHQFAIFNLFLAPRDLGVVFHKNSIYAALNTFESHQLSTTNFKPNYSSQNYWQLGVGMHQFDFKKIDNPKVKSIDVWQVFENKADSQLQRTYFYQDKRIEKIVHHQSKFERNSHVFWLDSMIKWVADIEKKVNRSSYDPRKVIENGKIMAVDYDDKGNLLYSARLESFFFMKEFSYIDSIVGEFEYMVFEKHIDDESLPRWYRITKTGFCFSAGNCTKIKEKKIYNLAGQNYLYNTKGQVIQKINNQNGFELFEYDKSGRMTESKSYGNAKLYHSFQYQLRGFQENGIQYQRNS